MDFDCLFDLEETFYAEGYELGVKDGQRAGYDEGSIFAVEKAFDKFQRMGRLYGKGIIWAKRLPGDHGLLHSSKLLTENAGSGADRIQLPVLPANPRLKKHIAAFLALVDPLTLSMQNTEDAVAEFDDRLKKALAKAKIIEKILGESSTVGENEVEKGDGGRALQGDGSSNIEDIGPIPSRLMRQA